MMVPLVVRVVMDSPSRMHLYHRPGRASRCPPHNARLRKKCSESGSERTLHQLDGSKYSGDRIRWRSGAVAMCHRNTTRGGREHAGPSCEGSRGRATGAAVEDAVEDAVEECTVTV